MPHWSRSPGFSNCKQDNAVWRKLEAKMQLLNKQQELLQRWHELEANMKELTSTCRQG
jgi:hypothetical protein